jgi:hypothetical protein
VQDVAYVGGHRGVAEAYRGKLDADQQVVPGPLPRGALPAGTFQEEPVAKAGERLDADHRAVVQTPNRLVKQPEPAGTKGGRRHPAVLRHPRPFHPGTDY